MGFKKMRSVRLPESEQGFIRYTCLTFSKQPEAVQAKINALLIDCGGEYSEALKEVMCSYKSIKLIAFDHHVSERLLYYRRKQFYEKW